METRPIPTTRSVPSLRLVPKAPPERLGAPDLRRLLRKAATELRAEAASEPDLQRRANLQRVAVKLENFASEGESGDT